MTGSQGGGDLQMRRNHTIVTVLAGMLLVAGLGVSTGCSGGGSGPVGGIEEAPAEGPIAADVPETTDMGYQVHAQHMADPDTSLPAFASTPELSRLYTFAYEHPEVLSYMPCTCGCGSMGHASNWNCYVKGIDASGVVTFDEHATICTICQEITADVIALWQRGSPLSEIREHVDANYPGPPTPTEYPVEM